jgi:hypothetical protein
MATVYKHLTIGYAVIAIVLVAATVLLVLLLPSDPDPEISPSTPSVTPEVFVPVPVNRGACLPFENFMHINGCPMTLV